MKTRSEHDISTGIRQQTFNSQRKDQWDRTFLDLNVVHKFTKQNKKKPNVLPNFVMETSASEQAVQVSFFQIVKSK